MKKILLTAISTEIVFYVIINGVCLAVLEYFDAINMGLGAEPVLFLIVVSCMMGILMCVSMVKIIPHNKVRKCAFLCIIVYLLLFFVSLIPISFKISIFPQLLSIVCMIPGIVICVGYLLFYRHRIPE